jgi:hypothetical protein
MNSTKPINLKMRAALNDKGHIYSFKVSLDPQDAAGNSVQFPIELKKGEIDKIIAKYSQHKDSINSKDITVNMTIQDKKLIDHMVCKSEPIVKPPPTPPPKSGLKVMSVDVITEMFKGLKVMVKEVKA